MGLMRGDAQGEFQSIYMCAPRSEQMVEILRAGGAVLTTDVALQTQRLTLDIVGLVAFSHDFRQAELTRRRAPPQPHPEDQTAAVSQALLQNDADANQSAEVSGCARGAWHKVAGRRS